MLVKGFLFGLIRSTGIFHDRSADMAFCAGIDHLSFKKWEFAEGKALFQAGLHQKTHEGVISLTDTLAGRKVF